MNPVSPVMPGSEPIEVILGKDQPEYIPLPIVYLSTPSFPVISRWRPIEHERKAITEGADVVVTNLTFGKPLQPIHLQAVMPEDNPVLLENA